MPVNFYSNSNIIYTNLCQCAGIHISPKKPRGCGMHTHLIFYNNLLYYFPVAWVI